jgi:hypothetical protein
MSIYEKITESDTCVYWGPPVPDGMGGNCFPDPVETGCRWTDTEEVIKGTNGEDVTSKSKIFTAIDVVTNGYLFHGLLTDLTSFTSPPTAEDAHRILRTKRVYNMRNTKLLRKAWV